MKKILLFGASGSIGQSTIALVRQNPDKFKIVGASAGARFKDLEKVAAELGIEHLLDTRAELTLEAITGFIQQCEPDIVLNAVGGFAGLPFTISTLELELPLALANKESLVAAGDLVMNLSRERRASIIPVDSEHSAIFQCLSEVTNDELRITNQGNIKNSTNHRPPTTDHQLKKFKKIFLTCSGGPFFGQTDLSHVTPEQALNHPNWQMGSAITVDSATLANKCLEYFEAMHLFGAQAEQIEIVVHPQSVVHSMVQFPDSSIMAQLSPPDMQLPIAYALNWPERVDYGLPTPDFTQLDLSFRAPDKQTFKTLQVLEHCAAHMGNLPIVFNAVNEEARNAFIDGKIEFARIFEVLEAVVEQAKHESVDSLEKVYEVDTRAREVAKKIITSS